MPLTPRQIAEAFSGHRFDVTFDHLADDVGWNLVGEDRLDGKDAVVAACRQSAAGLAGVTTTFETFKVVEGDTCVVVDAVGRYVDDQGGTSLVSSCDLYDFAGGKITTITPYAVELTGRS